MSSSAPSHWVKVFDRRGFLHRIMTELAGGGALISFEGRLSRCRFAKDAVVETRGEAGLLRRSTDWPPRDFIVLRLEAETVQAIFKQVDRWRVRLVHVQIEKDGVLQLVARENFRSGCVFTGPQISTDLLNALQSARIIYAVEVRQDPA
jgi:hypothetical protein